MAMTREEMQRLASYGRDGDTMLAHINPEEAALLKARGGSGTINPNTGLPEYRFGGKLTGGIKSTASIATDVANNPVAAVKNVAEPVVNPVQTAVSQVSQNLSNLPGSIANTAQQVAAPVKSLSQSLATRKNPFRSITSPIQKAVSQVSSNLANLPGSVQNTVKQAAANPITQVALAVYMPTIASYLGPYLTAIPAAYQTAVAGALASTALQTAQGVPFETALKNATVNAITSTGAPIAATYVEDLVGNQIVADALTSIGASAAKTAAMGGTKDDIEKNMAAALTGSGLTSALQKADVSRQTSRIAGATAGGAVVGGTTGAVLGGAGELGGQLAAEQAAKDAALERAKKGLAAAPTGTVSDTGQQLGEIVVSGKKEPSITDTSIIVSGTPIFADSSRAGNVKLPAGFTVMPIQLADKKPPGSYYDTEQNAWLTPVESVTPPAPAPAPSVPSNVGEPSLPTTNVTGTSETGITDTNIITPNVGAPSASRGGAGTPSLAPVTVTGRREPTIQDTDITLPQTTVIGKRETESTLPLTTVTGKREVDDILGEVTVKGEKEEEPIAGAPVEEEPPVDKQGRYNPNLFIYGGVRPKSSTLGSSLGTQAPFYPLAGTTGGLTSTRGAGELESKETGKKRQNVWNEESLRLKDALGI
jgi:hypothetical protein